jgi:hypothetical protein
LGNSISELTYVSEFGTYGTDNNTFAFIEGITTDGTHLFINDSNNNRIKKHLCSDLSYVSELTHGTGGINLQGLLDIVNDGTYIYALNNSGSKVYVHKIRMNDLVQEEVISWASWELHIQKLSYDNGSLYLIMKNEF